MVARVRRAGEAAEVHVVLPYVLPSFVVYGANASQDLAGETCLPDSEALPKILPLTARPPCDGAEEGDQGDSQRRADEDSSARSRLTAPSRRSPTPRTAT
jgi:hypothetical protein